MNKNYLININDLHAGEDRTTLIGGKAAGLLAAKKVASQICEKCGFDIEVPKSYVLTTEAFDEIVFNEDKVLIPNDVLKTAMRALVACGGNVSVRSNADVEDANGETHSGVFDSVLNVHNKQEMLEALQKVYRSAQNVPGARMGILIQPMIKPDRAGVAYSEEFNGIPNVVINYVRDKTADKLVVGEDNGIIRKHPKFIGKGKHLKRLTPCNVKELPEYNTYVDLLGELGESVESLFGVYAKCMLASVVSQMEESLGHPVDVEFAICKKPDGLAKLYILQQRSYPGNANLKVNYSDNGRLCGYFRDKASIVEGEVVIADGKEALDAGWNGQSQIEDYSGKIVLGKFSLSQEEALKIHTPEVYQHYQEATLKKVNQLFTQKDNPACKEALVLIDTLDTIRTVLYDHAGNVLRKRVVPFVIASKNEDFSEVKNGDYMRINLETGEYKLYPRHKLLVEEQEMGMVLTPQVCAALKKAKKQH